MATLDLRAALNTISDVVQNRPAPLREFDQIYMKVGDLVIQADLIARKFQGLDVVSIGDGDAICLSVMHLFKTKIFSQGPRSITVLDFDERIVNSINHFARHNDLSQEIHSVLYNVCDALPTEHSCHYDAFYTNPPWGASNDGQSVSSFVLRGIQALKPSGSGAIVIADDETQNWTGQVLRNTQRMLLDYGFIISEMIPALHKYHLDDAPDLASCCILARRIDMAEIPPSAPLPKETLINFYGRSNPLKVQYVRDHSGLNRGRAADQSYELEPISQDL